MCMFYQSCQPLEEKLLVPCLSVSPAFGACLDSEKESSLTGKQGCKNYSSQVTLPPEMPQNVSFSQMHNNLQAADCAGCKSCHHTVPLVTIAAV